DPAPEAPATDDSGWNVTVIPGAATPEPAPAKAPAKSAKAPATKPAGRTAGTSAATTASGSARYGEAVVREILGANFLEEQPIGLRDQPVTLGPDSGSDIRSDIGPEA
ncbi:MAG: hypothetical protein ABUL47_07885, partial [Leifsonia sp.]